MPFWVYVLLSESTGKRYVGQTKDLDRRVAEHNDPAPRPSEFTSRHAGPWRRVHSEQFDGRPAAVRRERFLKSGAGRAWLDGQVGGAGGAAPHDPRPPTPA